MTIDRRYALRRRVWEKKPKGPTARARAVKSRKLVISERVNKEKVRLRDVVCRFPRCGCRDERVHPAKRMPTVSHDKHKGMGGDPTGELSVPALMILLCKWRHQDAPVSRHAGTMKTEYLTTKQNDGRLAFIVDLSAVYPGLYETTGVWMEVGRETSRGVLQANLSAQQEQVLADLAEFRR